MSRMILEVKDLHAGYGATEVLHGLTMNIEEGSITTLLGANGAGKTTTLRALSKMIKVSGQILFDGKAIEGKSTEDIVRLGVAHVPDGRGTFGSLSTEENLQLGSYTRKDKQEAALDQEKMYNYFPRLKERRHQQAGTLSGGEQQMLATINEKDKVTILLVEQNAAMALDLAEHAYLLETGKLVLSGRSKDLQQDEAVRRSYLGH